MKKCWMTVSQSKFAGEWDTEKNQIESDEILVSCKDEFWWKCRKGHTWKTSPRCRRHNESGCHYCAGKKVAMEESLGSTSPYLLSEWDYEKNDKGPFEYAKRSNQKVWWRCGKGHSWRARILHRVVAESGCPECMSGWHTSRFELRVLSEIRYFFKDAAGRCKVSGVECDIYIPSLKLGIEIDGYHWHSDRYDGDVAKNVIIEKSGNTLIRVRESPLAKIRDFDVVYSSAERDVDVLRRILEEIELVANTGVLEFFDFQNEDEYRRLLSCSLRGGKSLKGEFPDIALEWHPVKNGPIRPEDVAPRSTMSVWWLCSRCGNEYEKKVWRRTYYGCPYCGGKRVWNGNSLRSLFPHIADEWSYDKNDGIKPEDVMGSSHKKVWWKCKHCGFEFKRSINARTSSRSKSRQCCGIPG